jgi:LytR cell envelope-related transcriptional attenuator
LELASAARRGLIAALALAVIILLVMGLARTRRERVAGHAFPLPSPENRVLVEVLNASGRQGLARQATRALRRQGLDVIYFGNAEDGSRLDTTRVLVRRGEPGRAEQVARALGVGKVEQATDTLRRVDVTVLLGRDFPGTGELHP